LGRFIKLLRAVILNLINSVELASSVGSAELKVQDHKGYHEILEKDPESSSG
jgi:hypothetical protein